MNKIIRSLIFPIVNKLMLGFIFCTLACNYKQVSGQETATLNFDVNFTVGVQTKEEKEIVKLWEELFRKDFLLDNEDSYKYWIRSERLPIPNRFLSNLNTVKKKLDRSQVTIISLIPISKDTFSLKTMITSTYDSGKKTQLEYIFNTYAVKTGQTFKFLSYPQWYYENWSRKYVGSIEYCFNKSYSLNEKLAIKLDSFNRLMSKLFKVDIQYPLYFVGKDISEAHQIMGYDFSPAQSTFNQYGAITEPIQQIVFAGNGNEYYPHEIVHLYTAKFWGKDEHYFHQWFDEGIAAYFGGYLGYPLEYHLSKLKNYLEQNPNENINDISKLFLVPNTDYKTDYMYAIGGLICKRIYESKGMEGLFDLLKSGSTDDDFYKAIEKHFNVKKENFGTFIRNELKNY